VWELGFGEGTISRNWDKMEPEIEKNWKARKISKGVGPLPASRQEGGQSEGLIGHWRKAQTDLSSPVTGLGIPCQTPLSSIVAFELKNLQHLTFRLQKLHVGRLISFIAHMI
jgi:hypothetical protein